MSLDICMKHLLRTANRKRFLLALCQLTLLLCSCAPSRAGRQDSFWMDARIQQRIDSATDAAAVLNEAEALLGQLDASMTRFLPTT